MFQPTPAPPRNFAQHAHPMNHENIQSSNQIPTPAHTGHRTVYAVQELLEGSNLCSSAVSLSDRFRRGGAWGFRIGSASRLKSLLYTVVPFFLAFGWWAVALPNGTEVSQNRYKLFPPAV